MGVVVEIRYHRRVLNEINQNAEAERHSMTTVLLILAMRPTKAQFLSSSI